MIEPRTISVDGVNYFFGTDGFPEKITLDGFNGTVINVNAGDFGRVRIRMTDGRVLTPFCRKAPQQYKDRRAIVLEYTEILWRDQNGNDVENFRLSLRYELMSRGRAFVNAFFVANDMHSPDMDEFSVVFNMASGDFPEAKWAFVPRPKKFDASMIQSMRSGRNLLRGDGRTIDGSIVPCAAVNVRTENGECAYFEVLMEGENSISTDTDDCGTDISWSENGDFLVKFDFIRKPPCKNKLMQLWQWRNQWGWVIKTGEKVRHKPPFHMHHYFDNYVRYPSDECLENLARSGTDVLVIHENWRLDIQNDGVPFDVDELQRTVKKAHELGIRVALYMRGNEISALDDACLWFDRFLTKNYDGIYMDYGGPFHQSEPDEAFPGGRIPVKNYMLRMEKLRERVGEDGLFYGHTGLSFTGIWYASGLLDGYVSGEGEGGVMVRSRGDHEYYSQAVVCTGTMWTGAFPAYSTAKMRPFLAAAGQYPHSPLGEQFKTCSLAHCREPGVNDIAFKPVWKIWKPFRNERNIRILNDFNSSGVFEKDAVFGHYLMMSADGKRALFVISNFAKKNQTSCVSFSRELAKFSTGGKKAVLLTPTEKTPGKAVSVDAAAGCWEVTLGANDVAAIYFESDDALFAEEIARFETPYPGLSAENQRYLDYLAEQTRLRNEPEPMKELYLSLTVPNTNLSYEYSLIYDLYYNAMALVEFMEDGSKKRLGWISQKGFVPEEPGPDDYIWPDVVSPRVPLHEILGKGKHFIGIESVHYGAPFYSFLSAELSKTADGDGAYTIYFMNELEPNREFLRWNVEII